jgi:epoxide hydrolase
MRSSVSLRLSLGVVLITIATAWSLAQRTPTTSTTPVAGSASALVPFKIHVEDAVLADLKERLSRARFPDELEGAGWTYGTNLDYLKQLVAYWRDGFDWREQERRLNRFEHFKTNIDELDIHFIHRRSKQPNALPIIMTHGWPSTFMEFIKVIEPLADPVGHGGRPEDAFDVVVPSIPGYGFSGRPVSPVTGASARRRYLPS